MSFLLELCRAQKWQAPIYETINMAGPSHMPNFLMRVIVNGIAYVPSSPSSNKKAAKVNASLCAINTLGYNL